MKAKSLVTTLIERHVEMARVIDDPEIAAGKFRRIAELAGFAARGLEREAEIERKRQDGLRGTSEREVA